jgi:exopolysaccharide biosynthesis protein
MSEPKVCEKHVSDKEKQAIMKVIEKTTEKVIGLAMKNGMIVSPLNADPKKVDDSTNLLVGIMNVGADVFQEKMGRPMSYSEMREMYG